MGSFRQTTNSTRFRSFETQVRTMRLTSSGKLSSKVRTQTLYLSTSSMYQKMEKNLGKWCETMVKPLLFHPRSFMIPFRLEKLLQPGIFVEIQLEFMWQQNPKADLWQNLNQNVFVIYDTRKIVKSFGNFKRYRTANLDP